MLCVGVSRSLDSSGQVALGLKGFKNVRVRFEKPGQGGAFLRVRIRSEDSLIPHPAT